MADNTNLDTLTIIENQISKLKAQDKLDLNDTRRLDILVKMRQLILGRPTEISESRKEKEFTDREVLSALKPRRRSRGKKTKAKS